MIEVVFWSLVALVGFAFVGFPIGVIALGLILHRAHLCEAITPSVSVLIAAYNESEGIQAKVRNTLAQQYPRDRLGVVVVDDGSDDGTAQRVRELDGERVRVVVMPRRGGKVSALNRGVLECTGEVLVFTDANAEFEPDAIARLVRPFADPDVGGVCGNQLNRRAGSAAARGDNLYWEFDKFLKRMESRTGSIVAADGSIYAIRREHFETVPLGVTDDFFISTGVVSRGARLVFAEDARSVEEALERRGDHFRRRIRITEQALHSLHARRDLMNPFRSGSYSFVIVGHKLLRRLAAPAILLLFPLSALLIGRGWVYDVAFGLQLLLYLAAVGGAVLRGRVSARLTAAPLYFVLGVVGTTVGLVRYLSGRRSLMWEPVRR